MGSFRLGATKKDAGSAEQLEKIDREQVLGHFLMTLSFNHVYQIRSQVSKGSQKL